MVTISLCMIVKNEEDVLKNCLESVKGIFDEIIIVDTGSTDKTKDIAKGYTDKIYDFQWIDDFSAARNFSFEKATSDYIMWLDADDIMLPEDRRKFKDFKKAIDGAVDMVMMKYNVCHDQQGNVTLSYFRERILKNSPDYRWKEPVHEYIQPKGNIIKTEISITHRKKRSTAGRNLAIYDKLLTDGENLSTRGIYYYARELKDNRRFDEAIVYFNRFLASEKGWLEDNINACVELSKCYNIKQDFKNSLKSLLKTFEYDTPRAETCCQLGYLYKSQKNYNKAIFWFKLAEGLERHSNGFVNDDFYGYIPCIELTVCYDKLGNFHEAIKYNNKAEKHKPNDPAVVYNKRYFERVTRSEEKLIEADGKNDKKRVLIVAHLFPPLGGSGVQRTLKFVKYLRDFGWEPVVITVENSTYPLKDISLLKEVPSDIEVHRFPEVKSCNKADIERILTFLEKIVGPHQVFNEYKAAVVGSSQDAVKNLIFLPDYYIGWGINLVNNIAKKVDMSTIDAIYTTTGPYSDHLIGYHLHYNYNIPWVVDFRDEWTNNPFAGYDKKSIRYRMEYHLEKKILDTANKVIVVTPVMLENYKKIFSVDSTKLVEITNGYDEKEFEGLTQESCREDVFQLYHNGGLYGIRTPGSIITAIKQLIEEKLISREDFRLIFAWMEKGEYWHSLVKEYGLSDCISFLGYMSHRDSLAMCMDSSAMLLLVGSGEKNRSTYTGKIFEYLRIGKPILSLSPTGSVVDNLLSAAGIGVNCEYNDISSIKKGILKLYSDWKLKEPMVLKDEFDLSRFERRQLTKALVSVLETL